MSVPELSFNFDSALALSIEMEEQYSHLDCRELGYSLFSSSPLISPEPTPPPSPSHQPTPLDGLDLPSISLPSPPDPQQMPRDSSAAVESPGGVKSAGRYRSNKMRSHAKRKRERANERMEREAGGLPYEVRAPTRLKYVHPSSAVNANLNLADIPISAPGYIGLRDKSVEKDTAAYRLEDLVGEGSRFKFTYQKWDGRWAYLPRLRLL